MSFLSTAFPQEIQYDTHNTVQVGIKYRELERNKRESYSSSWCFILG